MSDSNNQVPGEGQPTFQRPVRPGAQQQPEASGQEPQPEQVQPAVPAQPAEQAPPAQPPVAQPPAYQPPAYEAPPAYSPPEQQAPAFPPAPPQAPVQQAPSAPVAPQAEAPSGQQHPQFAPPQAPQAPQPSAYENQPPAVPQAPAYEQPAVPQQPQAPGYPYGAPAAQEPQAPAFGGQPAQPTAQQPFLQQPTAQQPFVQQPTAPYPPAGYGQPAVPQQQNTAQNPVQPAPYGAAPQQPQQGQQQPAAYGAPGAPQAYGAVPPGQGPDGGAYLGAPAPAPKKKMKKGLLVGLITGGAALVLLIVGGIVFFSLETAAHAPELQAQSYLDALKAGHAEQALKLDGTNVSSSDVLLTDKAYKASKDHITKYVMGKPVVTGETARVSARVTQNGSTYEQQFQLVKDGKDVIFFDKWKLEPVVLGRVKIEVDAPDDAKIAVDGTAVTPKGGSLTLNALPGSYEVAISNKSQWYTAEASTSKVQGFGLGAGSTATISVKLTDAGTKSATDAVNAFLAACAASTDPTPASCPFGVANASEFTNLSNQKWTITQPQFKVGDWVGDGFSVISTKDGSAEFEADGSDVISGGSGHITTNTVSFGFTGTVNFTDKGATFDFGSRI